MVRLIVAKAANNAIGKNNDLLWKLPADMQFFRQTTTGHIVVTGRKNWESIPEKFRPLPNRINAVITRNKDYAAPGAQVFNSLAEALAFYKNETGKDVFIIGGGQVYEEALSADVVDEMLITHVEQSFDGDTSFPEIDEEKWTKERVLVHAKDEKNAYDFAIWKYTRKPKNETK